MNRFAVRYVGLLCTAGKGIQLRAASQNVTDFGDDYDDALFPGGANDFSTSSPTSSLDPPPRGCQRGDYPFEGKTHTSQQRSTRTDTSKKKPRIAPPPPLSLIMIRNLPPSWGKTEVASFVMDCLGSDGAPLDLPESYIEPFLEQEKYHSRSSDAEELGGNGPNTHQSLTVTSFGTVSASTNEYGISIEDCQWYPVRSVRMFYSAKKGATLRRALVTFNPYPNLSGVVGAIRPDGRMSGGTITDETGPNHPLVRKMLRVNPEEVVPGINDVNKRYMGRQRLVSGSGLVEIVYYVDKRKAQEEHPDDYTKWTDNDRVLWEARNPKVTLEKLDIDRFLMSPDLLYDFERMKQQRYVAQDSLRGGNAKKAITVKSFLPSPNGIKNLQSAQEEESSELLDSVISEEIGRGSPQNLRIPAPYVDNMHK